MGHNLLDFPFLSSYKYEWNIVEQKQLSLLALYYAIKRPALPKSKICARFDSSFSLQKKIFAGSIAILKGMAVMFTRYIVKETKTANVNVEKKVDFLLNENKYGIV